MTDQTKQKSAQSKPAEYTCPKCGSPVQHTVLYSYPGKDKYEIEFLLLSFFTLL